MKKLKYETLKITYLCLIQALLIISFSCNNRYSDKIDSDSDTVISIKLADSVVFNNNSHLNFENFLDLFSNNFYENNYKYEYFDKTQMNVIPSSLIQYVNIPENIIDEFTNGKINLKNSLKSFPLYAISKIELKDSSFSFRIAHFLGNIKKKDYAIEFLINYNKKGKIQSVLPIFYNTVNSKFKTNCTSAFYEGNKLRRLFRVQDTTNCIYDRDYKFYTQEFIEIMQITGKGKIRTLNPKTNVLDLFPKKFVKVSIVKGKFGVIQTSEDSLTTLSFIPPTGDGGYYKIQYKSPKEEKQVEIILTGFWLYLQKKEFNWKYNGEYAHFWLRDIKTGKCNKSLSAVGGSGNRYVIEFLFPEPFGGYYTEIENYENKRIKIFDNK
jgi:hypothetical protein